MVLELLGNLRPVHLRHRRMESHQSWLQRIKQERRNQPEHIPKDDAKEKQKAEQVRAWKRQKRSLLVRKRKEMLSFLPRKVGEALLKQVLRSRQKLHSSALIQKIRHSSTATLREWRKQQL